MTYPAGFTLSKSTHTEVQTNQLQLDRSQLDGAEAILALQYAVQQCEVHRKRLNGEVEAGNCEQVGPPLALGERKVTVSSGLWSLLGYRDTVETLPPTPESIDALANQNAEYYCRLRDQEKRIDGLLETIGSIAQSMDRDYPKFLSVIDLQINVNFHRNQLLDSLRKANRSPRLEYHNDLTEFEFLQILSAQIDNLKQQLDTLKTQKEALVVSLKSANDQLTASKRENGKIAPLELAQTQLQEQLRQAEAELDNTNRSALDLQSEVVVLQQQLHQAISKVDDSTRTVLKLQSEAKTATQQHQEKTAENEKLQKQIKYYREKQKKQFDTERGYQNKIDELQSELTNSKSRLVELRQGLSDLREQLHTSEQSRTKTLNHLSTITIKQEEAFSQYNTKMSELQRRAELINQSLRDELDKKSAFYQTERELYESKNQQLGRLEEELLAQRKTTAVYQNKTEQLEAELSDLRERASDQPMVETLRADLASAEKILRDTQSEKVGLELEVNTLQAQLEQLRGRLGQDEPLTLSTSRVNQESLTNYESPLRSLSQTSTISMESTETVDLPEGLSDRLQQALAQLSQQKHNTDALDEQLKSTRSELQCSIDHSKKQEETISQLRQKLRTSNEKNETSRDTIGELGQKIIDLEEAAKKSQKEIGRLRESLERAGEEAREELEDATSYAQKTMKKNLELERTNGHLRTRLEEFELEINTTLPELRQENSTIKTAFEHFVVAFQQKYTTQTDQQFIQEQLQQFSGSSTKI